MLIVKKMCVASYFFFFITHFLKVIWHLLLDDLISAPLV